MKHPLDRLFNPKSVAVIGASDRKGSVGYALFRNLLDGQYNGRVYAVNPGHLVINRMKSYRSVVSIPQPVDLALIAAPARFVPKILRACCEKAVGGAVIISAGFIESGERGKELFREIASVARSCRMPVLGPNCVGFTNSLAGLNASFAKQIPPKGDLAFISQSSALGTAIIDWANDQGVGINKFISVGSMLDLGFHHLIDFLGSDPGTRCILIYMESLKDARQFMNTARKYSWQKPIILLKGGKSTDGARASLSHTGSMVGDDDVYRSAFRRAGVIQVASIRQLFDCAEAIAMQPLPLGDRLAIVTNAGGPGVLATDYHTGKGGRMADLTARTMEHLNQLLPAHWSRGNPVDVLGDASADTYCSALKYCHDDPGVDAVLAVFAPQALTDPSAVARQMTSLGFEKPVLACWMGEGETLEGREILEAGRIPNYRYPESVVDVFHFMHLHGVQKQMRDERFAAALGEFTPDRKKAARILRMAAGSGENVLLEGEAKALVACYGIPVPDYRLVQSPGEAKTAAREIGYPVALKIETRETGHKTELGGVILGIEDSEALEAAYAAMADQVIDQIPPASVEGVLVERMMPGDLELFFGARRDPVFGPVIAFGSGGKLVEYMDDLQLGFPPLNMPLAVDLVSRTRIFRLMSGYRDIARVDIDLVARLLVRFSRILMDFPEIREIDLNPLSVSGSAACALDVHIRFEPNESLTGSRRYSHLVIPPYPEEVRKELVLKDGTSVVFRPIRPEDRDLEIGLFHDLSPASLYQRFFGYINEVNEEGLFRLTHIDYDREMAILALAPDEGTSRLLGVVRMSADAWNDTAEYGIIIADKWQGRGLGSKLTAFIIEIARERKIRLMWAEVMTSNGPMLHILKKFGFRQVSHSNGVDYLELVL